MGQSAMMRCSASSPSMRGILTSRVTTSGRRARTFSSPSWPSTAVPTTSMSRRAAQHARERLAHEGGVVDHQHPDHGGRRAGAERAPAFW